MGHSRLKIRTLAMLGVLLTFSIATSASARTFNLDGSLVDWTQADRLDLVPGTGVEGFELYGYHDASTHKYHLALVANQAIGGGTTFWLNTDRDENTGYLLWGFLVGAEFNINIAADGSPHLYTGADGQNWVLGQLSHAYSADKKVFEVEFDEGMVAANTPINMWADVNNAIFLPGWYGIGGYSIDAVGVPAPPSAPVKGPIALDGDLTDWNPKDRIDRLPGTSVLGYELYGRADGQTYYLAIKSLPPAAAPWGGTTLWLNTDRDRSTGHKVWGIAVGAEHNINVAADGTPHLYSGAAAQNWLTGPLPHGRSADGTVLEIAIDRSLLDASAESIDVSVDVNNAVFIPADFTGPGYTLFAPADLPARATNRQLRVGIVYSATTEAKYFGDKAYSQLYAAMQHQCMQAGIPYTLLHEDDLIDINKIKDFDVLFLPYFANLPAAAMQEIQDTLIRAVYHYDIGLITAGNFLTNDEDGNAHPGDSYARMKNVLGLTLDGYFGPQDHTVTVGTGHPIVRSYAPGEQVGDYPGGYMQYYKRHYSVAQPFVTVSTNTAKHTAAWSVELGGRSVHFSSAAVMGDTDLAWRAILWSLYGDSPWVGVQVSRHSAVFIGRCDMDQSQYVDEVKDLYPALMKVIQKWKTNYNFVSSYYVNVGNNPAEGETTDWTYSGTVYKQLLSLGNEIGTHSYTHPHYTTQLSENELVFEFKDSRDVIAQNLGIDVVSAAVPGNPESLAVDLVLDKYFSYATADFSGTGAGYHGAMGFLTPDFNMVYLAPNLYFDFTMIGFLKYSAAHALAKWKSQYDTLAAHSPSPFMVWPWHDYGPTGYESPDYTEEMFTEFLAHAYQRGAEFTTGAEAAARIVSFTNTQLRVSNVNDTTITASVQGEVATGSMALRVETATGQSIGAVDGWPAFNGDRVLLGSGDRTYTVQLSTTGASAPHVSKLPMRARLQNVSSEPSRLDFEFNGVGDVQVSFPRGLYSPTIDCGVPSTFKDNVLTISFSAEGDHSCAVGW